MRPLLVDMSNFFFRFFASKKPVHQIAEDCLANLESFYTSLACDSLIIFSDYGKSVFRASLYPEYKANRKQDDPVKKAQLDKHFSNQNYVLKVLAAYYPCIKSKGIEADDLIAYVSKKVFDNCVILSSDQDLLQLEKVQFSPNRSSFISLEDIGAKSARQFITAKTLAGDSGDNIKGLERVGIKTALKYLNKYNTDNYDELCEAISPKTKSKIEKRILEGREVVERNEKLVNLIDFVDEIINEEVKQKITEILNPNEFHWFD